MKHSCFYLTHVLDLLSECNPPADDSKLLRLPVFHRHVMEQYLVVEGDVHTCCFGVTQKIVPL